MFDSMLDDYFENTFDYFNTQTLFSFPDMKRIIDDITNEFCYDSDEYDSEEEFYLDYLYYINSEINERLDKFNLAWMDYNNYGNDHYNSQNLFFNAYYHEYRFDADEWEKMINLIQNNPHKLLSNKAKMQKAEEIVKEAHKNQPYGDNTGEDDYFIWHLDNVRNHAKSIAENHNINPTKAQIVALLHDILEDTDYPPEEIEIIFGSNVLNSIKLLTFKKNIYPINQNVFNDRKDYYAAISEDPIAKVVKAADRFVNIYELNDLSDRKQRDNLFLKYLNDFQYFQEFNIYPEIIENAFLFLLNSP